MNSALNPFGLLSSKSIGGVDEAISRQVVRLLAHAYPPHRIERRTDQRFHYPYLIYLTPCTDDDCPLADQSIVVVGKNLSQSGLGFFHREPIAFRRMIASLDGPQAGRVAFLLDLTWCRFNGHGWYDSGGRFLEVVPSPI